MTDERIPDKPDQTAALTPGSGTRLAPTASAVVPESAASAEVEASQSFGAYRGATNAALSPNMGQGFGVETGQGKPMLGESTDPWKEDKAAEANKTWMDKPIGRIAIRAFSRGVTGSITYAAGSLYAKSAMENYTVNAPKNPLQFIAHSIDTALGKPIQAIVGKLYGEEAGKRAVTFRNTRDFGYGAGRTLGHEVVDVTFNFACASVGDAMGRNIAGLMDPHTKTKWLKNGQFSAKQFVKDAGMALWRAFSYSQGEDWFVAVPYVYFMKAQRALLEKISPGFKYDFDHEKGGGSYKIDLNGNITGTYAWEGALDLQTRFTVYNVGTLMYRKMYNTVGEKILHWKNTGYTEPLFTLPKTTGQISQAIYDSANFLFTNTTKAIISMTPTVPFFWSSRVPQAMDRGLGIVRENKESGKIICHGPIFLDRTEAKERLSLNQMRLASADQLLNPATTIKSKDNNYYFKNNNGSWDSINNPFSATSTTTPFNPYLMNIEESSHRSDQRWWNLSGLINHKLLGNFQKWTDKAVDYCGIQFKNENTKKDFVRAEIQSALSYTQYFAAKTEFAHWIDTKAMDNALNVVFDGMVHLNTGEFFEGFRRVGRAMARRANDVNDVGVSSVFAQSDRHENGHSRRISFADQLLRDGHEGFESHLQRTNRAPGQGWRQFTEDLRRAEKEKQDGVTLH